ncbi:hypothetical protein V1517DRAFT_333647 [Lipomyces orientalis]|uniref:Uncharacterized protein n=1 Tax=Lipomyces orientalis TaxID=1233043 RepID=A0ACC3TDA7_9ASCO
MSPGIDAVVRAAEAAAATAGKGRDESCYVASADDVRSGVAGAAASAAPPPAAAAAAAVVPMARTASLPKSVKPVAFVAKNRDYLAAVKLEDEENAEYSFPLPRPEHSTFLASGGTESTVSLHSDAAHGDDTEITLAMAEKALANISAYTHPSSPGPLDDVYYDQNASAVARSPGPRQHHYRASLAELEPNLVPQQTDLPSSPLRPESDDDEYVAGKTPPSSLSPSPAPPRRACKRRAPAPTTTGTTAPTASLLSSSSSSSASSSCASPVRKSARLHKTLLF